LQINLLYHWQDTISNNNQILCNISRAYQSIKPAYNVELIIDAISILDFQLSHITWFFSIFSILRSLYCTYLFFEIFYFGDFSVSFRRYVSTIYL